MPVTSKTPKIRVRFRAVFVSIEESLSEKKMETFFSGRAEWYITLDPADKDKIISQVQAHREAHRNSVQHDLDHWITAFQSKIKEGPYYICSVCNRILHRKLLSS